MFATGLAEYHERNCAARRAARLRALAEYREQAGGLDDPPPAVALAMPIPRRPRLTWAIGLTFMNLMTTQPDCVTGAPSGFHLSASSERPKRQA